jgi:hypothetical protein
MFIKKMAIVYGGTLFFATKNPATNCRPSRYSLGLYTKFLIFSFQKWQEKKHVQKSCFKEFSGIKKIKISKL